MSEIILSRIHPDYAQVRAQFQLALSGLDTWTDLLPTATGQAVIDFVAAVGDLDQYAIEASYKEAFLDAGRDSSIYAIAKLLGVRLVRKSPGTTTVTLTRTDTTGTLTIPSYTQFSAGSTSLFNRAPIVMNIGVTALPVTLYEGVVKSITNLSDGSDFQLFITTDKSFTVSDADVLVFAAGQTIPVTTNGLWTLQGDEAVQDLTYSQGELVLLFGNDDYGYKPAVNTNLTFQYVVTQGLAGNNAAFTGQKVTCGAYPVLKGVATTGLAGGADERDASFYRQFGPQLYTSSSRAVLKDEWTAEAVQYDGVADALCVGQKDLSPSDLRFMNLVRVSLLTTSSWGQPQIDAFTTYLEGRVMFPVRFYFQDPSALPVDIVANVYCRLQGDLDDIEAEVNTALVALFAPRAGIIGLNFYRSDIFETIRTADQNIAFIELVTPSADVYPMFQPPKPPVVTEILNDGTIGAGLQSYAVTVITEDGETLANNIGTQTFAGTASAALVTWDAVPGALGYNIYGRTFPTAFLIATVGPTATNFTDVGFPLGTTVPPAFDTSGVRYCSLGNVTLNMFYTNRRLT
jgi:hypothetical protein